jgi:hypothetical protein
VHHAAPLLEIADRECAQFVAIALELQPGGIRPRLLAKIG